MNRSSTSEGSSQKLTPRLSEPIDLGDQLSHHVKFLRDTLASSAISSPCTRSTLYSTFIAIDSMLKTGNIKIDNVKLLEINACSNSVLLSLFEFYASVYCSKFFSYPFRFCADLDSLLPSDTSNPAELIILIFELQPQLFVDFVNQTVWTNFLYILIMYIIGISFTYVLMYR